MKKTTESASQKLQEHSSRLVSYQAVFIVALLVSLVLPKSASAAIVIDPGAVGDSFFTKTFNVTSEVRSAGVRNANGTVKVLDFIFSELKNLRVNGDGLNITAKLETSWGSNPSGLSNGFDLWFGDANSVVWTDEGSTLFGDSSPVAYTTPPFTGPPNEFDVTGSIVTHSFPTYLVDFNGLSFNFRVPNSANLGFLATIAEEQLVMSSATLTLSSVGRPTGVPGLEVFSQYTVVSVPEPSSSALTACALLALAKVRRRRRSR